MSPVPASAEFPAWGGVSVVAVADSGRLESAVGAVERVIADVDLACSSFRSDSELARINASPGVPLPVSPLLLDYVEAALRAAELTDGDVDPTVGEALLALGFTDGPAVPEGARYVIRRVPGYRAVKLDRSACTIQVPADVRLDLGATAKALAADQAAAAAHEAAGCGVLVSLSGDLAIAGTPPAEGWKLRVTDDHRSGPEAPGQWISLRSGGLATSSTTVRRRDGAHHLIDPRTGHPATVHFRTVSVAAASCLDANIASTATIVRGQRGQAWLQEHGLPSRLVLAEGGVQHVAGWPADSEDLPLGSRVAAGSPG